MSSTSPNSCALYCSTEQNANSKWKYEVGKVYSYEYNVETTTLMEGTATQSSKVSLSANAKINVKSTCNFELTVSNKEKLYRSGDIKYK